jgi:hypothetical protein
VSTNKVVVIKKIKPTLGRNLTKEFLKKMKMKKFRKKR